MDPLVRTAEVCAGGSPPRTDQPRLRGNLGMQGTTVLAGAAEAHWTRGLVERHGDYLREMVAKMELDGIPADISVQCVIDRAAAAKNMMSRIRGYAPSQWVLAYWRHNREFRSP